MTIDMHGKASVVIVDDRTDEEREADTLRRCFELQWKAQDYVIDCLKELRCIM